MPVVELAVADRRRKGSDPSAFEPQRCNDKARDPNVGDAFDLRDILGLEDERLRAAAEPLVREPAGEPPPERRITIAVAGEVRTYSIADPATGLSGSRPTGVLTPARRQPTADEIRRINESLAAMERSMDTATPPKP